MKKESCRSLLGPSNYIKKTIVDSLTGDDDESVIKDNDDNQSTLNTYLITWNPLKKRILVCESS